ncbi:MAG TPA: S8 family serine peptidase, partial [Acidimicrobiales bacterium]|nr:S8 family serine peptidase [Acidimicrobiales bacterium]
MRVRTFPLVVGAALSLVGFGQGVQAQAVQAQSAPSSQAPLSTAEARALSTNVTQKVIVVMKKQAPEEPDVTGSSAVFEAAEKQAQQPLLSELQATHARDVRAYSLINAVAATVSPGERARLEGNPSVAAVVPDQLIALTNPMTAASQFQSYAGGGRGRPGGWPTSGTTPLPGACAPPGQVQLNPQAIETIHADSQDPTEPTARSLGITGAGVKVAFLADGLDINNPDLIRPDGQHVIVDYEDFSGEGTSVPTGGGEAFLDAGSIAAQGNQVYDVSHYSDLPLNRPCDIRIEGVAPGASLVALDVLGAGDAGFASSILQAINYAVTVDHVNVLNESLGDNPYPDDVADLDLIKAANDAAVAAGTTVVVASGDAGVTNTIASPSSDPNVISVGATTTYRSEAQDGVGGSRFPGVRGWLNNNISSASGGGFTQRGATVTVVAPGELNWALCSTNTAEYSDCVNYAGQPSPILQAGGTSESSPLTAGTAALVIQAYAKTHGGEGPTPQIVKQILASTADDIGAPAAQQGAGLVDAYKAVLAAESYGQTSMASTVTGAGHRPPPGTLLNSTDQFNVVAAPGATEQLTDNVTNDSASTQDVTLSTRALTDYQSIKTAVVELTDTASPQFSDWSGITNNYEPVNFIVPPGADRLNTAIAFQSASATNLDARVKMALVDADGDLAGYSSPQGDGNYGDVQVTDPVPGRWTAYIFSHDSANGGTTSPVLFGASVAHYTSFGTVSPPSLELAP